MSSRTIFGTILAISATVILISQFVNNSATTTENFINYPITIKSETTSHSNNLTGHLPDSTFVSSGHYDPKTVIGAANTVANNNMGMAVQLMQTTNPTQSEQAMFSSFAAAAGKNVEHYSAKKSKSGCQTDNTLEPLDLPISGFTATDVATGSSHELGADGEIGAAFNTSRLMYTTLKRKTCGQADRIRGDLAIAPCPIVSRMAAKPHDTLESGAFAAMFGTYAETPQKTAAMISADTLGMRTTLGGENLSHSVQTQSGAPVLTSKTFIPSSFADMQMSSSNRGVSGNELTGGISGYSSFV